MSIVGQIPISAFIYYLSEGTEWTLSKFTDSTKVRRGADTRGSFNHPEGPQQAGEVEEQKQHGIKGESPASGEEQSQAPTHARGHPSRKQFCRRDPEDLGVYQGECEPDLFPCVHVQQNWIMMFWAALGDMM